MSQQLPETIWRRGAHIYLRPVKESDVPQFQCWVNDPENSRYIYVTQPMSMVAEHEWYKRASSGDPDKITVAICLNDGTLIGTIGMKVNVINQSAFTGTIIGPYEHKGKGYATEAKMLMLDYAFNWRSVRNVTSRILAINSRSKKYAVRCGYRYMATIEKEHFRKGTWVDELLFVVFADEWRPLWELYCNAPNEFLARRRR